MQITIELDDEHLQTLHEQEAKLKKNVSELIALSIDKTFPKKRELTEGEKLLKTLQETGFLGSLPDEEGLSENYKQYMDWSEKI